MGCGSSKSFNYSADIDVLWQQVGKTLDAKRGDGRKKKLIIKRSGWKTIRLFVSSTFKDFHTEREILIKQIFPDLRQWCEKRKLHLIDCDLRWGIPKDTKSDVTLRTCLEEIDRCYAENIMPFFLNLTSERCGWIPNMGDVPESLAEEYRWIMGLSVTEMEIMHGSYRKDNPNSLFMLRNSSFLDTVPDGDHREQLVDPNPIAPQKLKILKESLRSRFPKEQVCFYNCEFDEIGEDGIIKLKGFDSLFSKKVFEFFKERIEKQYPLDAAPCDPYEQARQSHEAFMKSRSVIVLGRTEILEEVKNYVVDVSDGVPTIITGGPGSGKSSLMARIADLCTTKAARNEIPGGGDAGWYVFYHFVGAVPGSTSIERCLKRLLKELAIVNEATMPGDLESTCQLVSSTLSNTNTRPLVLIVDALNQFDEDSSATILSWLPTKLAPQIRVIFAMITNTPPHKMLQDRTNRPVEIRVTPLDIESRQEIVKEMLGKYNKRLDQEQMSLLLSKGASQNPLWLSIACEELRVFGLFQKVTEKINGLADGLLELLDQILDRFERENGGRLLKATLCLLEASAAGLLETELLALLGDRDGLVATPAAPPRPRPPPPGNRQETRLLPAVQWATVYRALRPFLRPFGDSGEGRLDFYHRSLSKAVRIKYFNNPDDVEDDEDSRDEYYWWHSRLADFFQGCDHLERRVEEYPVHLVKMGNARRLAAFLAKWEVFDHLYDEEYSSLLLHYWRKAGGGEAMESSYMRAFTQLKEGIQTTQQEIEIRCEQLSRVLLQEHRLDASYRLLMEAMALEEDRLGARPERLVELYETAAMLHKERYATQEYIMRAHFADMKACLEYLEKTRKLRETLTGPRHEYKKALITMRLSYELLRWARGGGDHTLPPDQCLERGFELVKESKRMFEQLGDEPFLIECTMNEGMLANEMDDPDMALGFLQEALEMSLRILGEYHMLTGRIYLNMGIIREEGGDHQEAYDCYVATKKNKMEVYGPDHPQTQRLDRMLSRPYYKAIAAQRAAQSQQH